MTRGAGYGIVEEGLMVKSYFDTNWVDLGPLGSFGRWAGVNWIWETELTIFHAVFSIAIPILPVMQMVPEVATEPWVRPRTLTWLALLLSIVVAIAYCGLTPYSPPARIYVLSAVAVCVLVWVARRLPAPPAFEAEPNGGPRDLWFALVGLPAATFFFPTAWALPGTGIHPIASVGAKPVLAVGTVGLLRRMSKGTGWQAGRRLVLASGALGFLIFLAPVQQMDIKRADAMSGTSVVGLAAVALLIWLARRLRKPMAQIPAKA
jgi:hypothetical protein